MGNESATETITTTSEKRTTSGWVLFIYLRVLFVFPIFVAVAGVVGYLQWTMAGFPFKYAFVWLLLSLASVSWAYTHWLGFLKRKPSDT